MLVSGVTIIDELEAYLANLVAEDKFSGAVLVGRNDKILFAQAYGLASKAFNVPNRTDTKFNLASMNKMFTGVAIAQLAQQGKLSFNDRISIHLPSYPFEVANHITIHHLLTHTSGLGSYWNSKRAATWTNLRSINDYLPLFIHEPLLSEPGSRWAYSNAGYIVLGAIIEAVSNQNYFDYVRNNIYKVAGMPNTDAYDLDYDVPNLAIGYTNLNAKGQTIPGPRRNNLFMHVIKGGPAGGGFSTVEDLFRFNLALRSHQLLTTRFTEVVTTGKVVVGAAPTKYAYGFVDTQVLGNRVIGHNGNFPGISAQIDMYWNNGYTVVVLSNYDPARGAEPVISKLRELISKGRDQDL